MNWRNRRARFPHWALDESTCVCFDAGGVKGRLWRLVAGLKKRAPLADTSKQRSPLSARGVADAAIFAIVFLVSAIAVAALAVAAPIVLALSGLIGLIANKKNDKGWRAAGA